MKDSLQKGAFGLSSNLADELLECLKYEAYEKINNAEKDTRYRAIFDAFLNLGRAKHYLLDNVVFEEQRALLYEYAKNKLESRDFPESELKAAAESGLRYGERRPLPTEMGLDSIHFGFVAEMVSVEIVARIRYVEGAGWEVWENQTWRKRAKERGIVGLIYKVMKRKIDIWRKALAKNGISVRGKGGWLEKLEKNINDPEWLSEVEKLLLQVDYFGVEIVPSDNGSAFNTASLNSDLEK